MSRTEYLPFSRRSSARLGFAAVTDTLRSGWITTGPKTKAFERSFGAALEAPGDTSLMLSSCTAALHLALAALGVGPGDEVIVPTLTFAATANVVVHLGATPVLVDVEPDTLCIDVDAVARAITERTRALMPVHYAGHPADLDPLFELAAERGIAVVEDAAHAAATRYRGVRVGSRDNLAAFSFYATKNMTTAEGGALTGDPALIARARELSAHGMSADGWKRFDKTGSWQYDVTSAGFKANMTDIQAALGLVQLERLSTFQEHRRHIVERYHAAFGRVPALQIPVERDDVESSWHLYVLRIRPELLTIDRNHFIRELSARNIGTSVHYVPLHDMSYYSGRFGFAPSDFPVAQDAYERMMSLPLNAGMSDRDADDVIEAVLEIVRDHPA